MKTALIVITALLPFVLKAQVADSAQRVLKLQGAINARDIGGYATADGHHVKWNRIYRSASINKLSDSDLVVFNHRKIDYVVDFRGVQESAQAPDKLNEGTVYLLLPAGSNATTNDWMKTLLQSQSGDSLMMAYYSNTAPLTARYKPFFNELLQLPDSSALLYHCTAGKDRTGIATALLLYALGVPYETIMQDYLASNTYRKAENEQMVQSMVKAMHVKEGVAASMAAVKKEYLDATFNAITQNYGSVDAFLANELGINNARRAWLRNKFLQ
ncbi:tyrosine-protein phosphatase [Parafilimonas sp.]|uniref:tyrosine-protein phosphatase n=1 Tax=Parafilimonas sp. TaxID=1969739 RepID=UPI0039E239D0